MTTPFGESTSGPGEALLRHEIIGHIQALRDEYRRRDNLAAGRQIGQASAQEAPGRYVVEELANKIVPAQHHRMVFMPLARQERVQGIAYLYLRVLTPYYERESEQSTYELEDYVTHETPQWNDVFVELLGEREEPLAKYLLNNDGLVPYETVETPDDPDPDVIRNRDYQLSGNLYIAKLPESSDSVFPFDLDALKRLIGSPAVQGEYTPARQGNTQS